MALRQESKIILKGEDKTKKAFQSVRGGIDGIAGSVKAMTGLLAGGAFVLAGKQSLDAADKIQKLSIRLGASTEALSQYRHVAELTGVQFDTLTTSMQRATRRIAEAAATGKGEAAPALKELGLNAQALAALKPEEQFEAIADAMQGVSTQGDKVRLSMKLFDTEGVALLQTMEGGAAAIRQMRGEADALGKTLSRDQVDAAAAANDAIVRLKAGFGGMIDQLAIQLAPLLTGVANMLSSTIPIAVSGATAAIKAIQFAISTFVRNVSALVAEWFEFGASLDFLPDKLQNFYAKVAGGAREIETVVGNLAIEFGDSAGEMIENTKELAFELGEAAQVAEVETTEAFDRLAFTTKGVTDNFKDAAAAHELVNSASQELTNFLNMQGIDTAKEMGDTLKDSADEAKTAWDSLLSLLPSGIRQIAGALGQLGGGFSNAIGGLLFGRAGTPGGGIGPSQGLFGGFFGSGGVPSTAFNALGVGAGVGTATGSLGAGIGSAVGYAAASSFLGGQMVSQLMNAVIPGIGAIIGAVLGRFLEGLFTDTPDPRIALVNTQIDPNGQYANDFTRTSAFGFTIQGQQITETFGRENATAFIDAIQQFDEFVAGFLTPSQIDAARSALLGPGETRTVFTGNISVEEAITQRFQTIVSSLENPLRAFVQQFSGDVETGLEALLTISKVMEMLNADPVEAFEDAMARAGETTVETLVRMGSELDTLASSSFDSIENMQAFGDAIQRFDEFVVQTLFDIANARQAISTTISGTIDNLRFQTLSGDQRFTFLTTRAQDLIGGIGGLNSASAIQNQIGQISGLLTQAFQLASPEEQAALLDNFITQLNKAEADAQARLDIIEGQVREEAQTRHDELVGAINTQAENLAPAVRDGINESNFGTGADMIFRGGQAILTAAGLPVNVQIQYTGFDGEIGGV